MDWFTHTLSAVGGAVATGVPLFLWAWRQSNTIRTEQARASLELDVKQHELDKVRESDAYMALKTALADTNANMAAERQEMKRDQDDLCRRIDTQSKKIDDLHGRELDCLKTAAKQEVEIFKQASIIQFLESRVRTLETTLLPAGQTMATQPGTAIAAAVKDLAKEAIAESPTQPKGA